VVVFYRVVKVQTVQDEKKMQKILMSFAEAARALHCPAPADGGRGFSSVCIDSREVQAGALFVALAGEETDGHRFVKQAFSRGAAGAIVEKAKCASFELDQTAEESGAVLLETEGSLRALQDLAGAYLEKFPALLRVGISGSSGKTTTKELVAAMTACEKSGLSNRGNLNSETGLPLSVFRVRTEHEVGIFELGMNRQGEIAELAAVLKPQFALVTNIGSAHIGCIGSKEGIAREKKALFSQFTGSETALIPEEDAFAGVLAENVNGNIRYFGEKIEKRAGKLVKIVDRGLSGWELIWEEGSARCALPGRHNLQNALAACALGREIGCSERAIRHGLESAKPLFGRSEIFTLSEGGGGKEKTTLIRDCYNANPESMAAALDFCDAVSWAGRRVYVIGAMLELGGDAERAHAELGERLAASAACAVYLFGKETETTYEVLQKSNLREKNWGKNFQTNDIEALKACVKKNMQAGDMILLKGSRGCALERVCEVLGAREEMRCF
jgi:UDP-N-acetylmuramoyl-tripeptide--D-alanyl-D-alanine ligase